ncbi:MAG TPA: hypothetical protein PLN06_01320 [Bacteroidales bacterium]|nr:hypothetical protein [Bacteroidales bacterium]HOU95252.1 hypothetical protein [Bacteroidales bacterium]HQG35588.1 hypothetical protein [Bacteroidales bacterium]HQG51898.1 hypothetical protein [Bacteroidales bacterium]HQJ19593.1 hypothetical protein [Bacteroidales bacterium]
MKTIRIISAMALLLFALSVPSQSQCKAFAKKEGIPELAPYIHDGNYHAAILVEGEEAELYKTFYSDMEYRLVVIGESKLPAVEFKVMDENKNILYSNKDHNYAKTWDFKLEASKQLKLVLKVSTFNKAGDIPASGCVAIMFGFKVKK